MESFRIAVIGAGGTGMAMAADLTLRGYRVSLFEQKGYHVDTMEELQRCPNIELLGNAGQGITAISLVTHDIAQALCGADFVLVSSVANRHQELAQLLAPHLRTGQTVCFSSGNCASLRLRLLVPQRDILIGELQGNLCPCRKVGPGQVLVAMPQAVKGAASSPGADTSRFVASLSRIYPCQPVQNVFEATLNSPNLVIHLAASLLNLSKMESSPDFRLYRDGLTPGVFRLLEAMEEEKQAVMSGMGYTYVRSVDFLHSLDQPSLALFRELDGPTGLSHRYLTEDAYAGVNLMTSLAAPAGCQTPIAQALVTLASALNQTDYAQEGLSLRTFGLEGRSASEINDYLETGELRI